MDQNDFAIKILNEAGEVIGSKPRAEINKKSDIVHCADVLIVQGGKIVLAKIPVDGKALYGGMWAVPTATMVRVDESAEQAAHRSLQKELGVTGAALVFLGDHFFSYPDGVKRLKSTFTTTFAGALHPNPADVAELHSFTRDELESAIHRTPEIFAPTFLGIWEVYHTEFAG